MEEFIPTTVKEVQYGIDQMAKGFADGYHKGLKEGYSRARYPEICHCCHCRSHGQWCGVDGVCTRSK